ncbi:MAG: hypothetical protein ACHQ6U_04685 [Thermodesulfobacteriota bacterium]
MMAQWKRQAIEGISMWVELYNRKRPHSNLGDSPVIGMLFITKCWIHIS